MLGLKGLRVSKASRDRKETRGLKVTRVHKASKGSQAMMVLRVPLVLPERI